MGNALLVCAESATQVKRKTRLALLSMVVLGDLILRCSYASHVMGKWVFTTLRVNNSSKAVKSPSKAPPSKTQVYSAKGKTRQSQGNAHQSKQPKQE